MVGIRFFATAILASVVVAAPVSAQQAPSSEAPKYQTPPPSLAALADAPPAPAVSVGPTRDWMVVLGRPALPSIEELSEPEVRLAGMRLNPQTNGPSRATSFNSLQLQRIDPAAEAREITGIPSNPRIRNVTWNAAGTRIAFTLDLADEVALYVLDVGSGAARRATDRRLNDAAPGSPFRWTADDVLVARVIPAGRQDAPAPPITPTGPVIEETTGEAAPARTYQDLLQNPYDESLFEYYFTSELITIAPDGGDRPLGIEGIITYFDPAPDAKHLLVERHHRPFSYLVPISRFPAQSTVHDLSDGRELVEIAYLPLAENVPTGFGSVRTGRRSIGWRADQPSTVYWAEALDDGDIRKPAEARDQLYQWAAPFSGEPVELVTLPLRYSGIIWGDDDLALVREFFWETRTSRLYEFDPSQPGAELRLVFDLSTEDRYADPGNPVTEPNDRGFEVLATADGGASIFLVGQGASPEGNRPFIRKMDLASGDTEELFRSDAPYYEVPVELIDLASRTILTRRESVSEPPNYFLRNLRDGSSAKLTDFPHPYPQFAGVHKEVITYERGDGVPLSATMYLPAGYDAERDGPLPTFVWAYPTEFKSADAAGQRRDSPYQFTSISYWGAVPWVTRGYAVMDDAAMPIIGEGDREPNDTFVEQLVSSAQAVIDEGVRRGIVDPDRVGIGGHSYGAFMTANLLAHSDLFQAGIARSGAYNRTLTPFGFQAEQRTYWEAPEIYYAMSPFMHADKVDEPILMIHGIADNNSGTFPMQSERFYHAIKGLGGTARLVMLPHESHGYRARESILHMLWEMDTWLETYVKN